MQKWEYVFVTCQVDGQRINAVSINGELPQVWPERREKDLVLYPMPEEDPSPIALYELSNELGKEGWEFVSIEWAEPMTAIFKRPKPSEQ